MWVLENGRLNIPVHVVRAQFCSKESMAKLAFGSFGIWRELHHFPPFSRNFKLFDSFHIISHPPPFKSQSQPSHSGLASNFFVSRGCCSQELISVIVHVVGKHYLDLLPSSSASLVTYQDSHLASCNRKGQKKSKKDFKT